METKNILLVGLPILFCAAAYILMSLLIDGRKDTSAKELEALNKLPAPSSGAFSFHEGMRAINEGSVVGMEVALNEPPPSVNMPIF